MAKILIVEDETSINDILVFNLHKEGFETDSAYDGEEGLDKALTVSPDLVLLDVMLPKMEGWEVLKRLREKSSVPVVMLTAREEEADKVQGLELGADDYVTKPFSMRELVARVRSNLRRVSYSVPEGTRKEDENILAFGSLAIHPDTFTLTKNGAPIELTSKEFALVLFLAQNCEKVFSREQLMTAVWGYGDFFGDLRAVDVMIRRIREKTEDDPSNPIYIKTKRGLGYYFDRM